MDSPTLAPYSQLSDYDYELPRQLIAKYPLPERDASRMMLLNRSAKSLQHSQFRHLNDCLCPGDLLVLNNTKVRPVRLIGHREGHTGRVELLLLNPVETSSPSPLEWDVLMRPAKKLSAGTQICFPESDARALILGRGEQGKGRIRLQLPEGEQAEAWIQQIGTMPIPPYLEREADASDKERYQTVYSKSLGSQAAPTAGLHFTPASFERLAQRGVAWTEVTLHVGLGTFRPVLSDQIDEHEMDPEFYCVEAAAVEAIQACKARGGRVVAVGTTALKTIETVSQNQNGSVTAADSGWSQLFIKPGFEFKAADGLITNFHLPKSTLMMLVSAFAGYDLIKEAYQAAVDEQYRFYSYGDCMLIL